MTMLQPPSRLALAVPFALLVPAAAAAQGAACPAEFGAGVDVVYSDGGTSLYRPGPDGAIVETALFPDGGNFREMSLFSVHVLRFEDVDDYGNPLPGNTEIIDYRGALASLPEPVAGLVWSQTVLSMIETNAPVEQRRTLNVSSPRAEVYGDCRYDVLATVLGIAVAGEPTTVLGYDYVPALGIAFFRSFGYAGQSPDTTTVPVRITAASN